MTLIQIQDAYIQRLTNTRYRNKDAHKGRFANIVSAAKEAGIKSLKKLGFSEANAQIAMNDAHDVWETERMYGR